MIPTKLTVGKRFRPNRQFLPCQGWILDRARYRAIGAIKARARNEDDYWHSRRSKTHLTLRPELIGAVAVAERFEEEVEDEARHRDGAEFDGARHH